MKAAALLLMCLMGFTGADAQWALDSQTKPVPLEHEAWQVSKVVSGTKKATLELVFWKDRDCKLSIVSQAKKADAWRLDLLAKKHKAIAVCNGGYFDPPKFLPVGLQISNGAREGSFLKGLPFGGGVLVRGGKPQLYIDAEFVDGPEISDLLQCCPVLVNDGAAYPESTGGPEARRTFLLTDGGDIWAMGVSTAIGLKDLALVLSTPGIMTECKVTRALNLDGGPSTGLWYKDAAGVENYTKEMWRVKNILCITPRS